MTQSNPYLIGLTGGIACGKSNLSEALKNNGVLVIDADEIARDISKPGGEALPGIRQIFGGGVFDGEALNRAKLAGEVFGKPEKISKLNAIMHPLIFAEMESQIKSNRYLPALVADVPLLYETGFDRRCDEVWCALAPREEQVIRLLRRGLSLEEANLRIDSQMPAEEKARRADHVIKTTGDKEDSARTVLMLWQETIRRLLHG